ncbi:MAG TPA: hypothetical protein VGK48_18825 [Terriglobia bacterium]
MLLAPQAADRPPQAKNDPNGVWQSDSGTKFDLRLTDSNLKVKLVEGSNPVYLKYEVDLKNAGEVNTYAGAGYFVAKLPEKECRFDTNWNVTVVQPETIVAVISHIVPDPATCEVKDRRDELTELKKIK